MRSTILLVFLMATAQDGEEEDNDENQRKCGSCCCGGARKKKPYLPGVNEKDNSISKQLEERFNEHKYALSVKPTTVDKPIQVKVTLLIESITDVSEVNMDLTTTFVIYQSWTDPRLRVKSDDRPLKSVVLPSRLIQHLWVPDTYVVGSKSSVIHKTTTPNQAARIWPTGRVLYSLKLTATVACLMSLHNFPMDTETCSISLQSFAYDTEELELVWDSQNINEAKRKNQDALFMDISLVNNMPKFKIIDHGYNFSTTRFMLNEEGLNTPKGVLVQKEYNKSRLTVTFEFERYFISVFFQSYFPAMIMVMLGGLTMWIDPKSVPARVSMGITTVLTISTIITGLKSSLPRVSYLTALDIYLWTCYFFVFSAVLEFCVLNFLMARKGRVRDKLVESRIKVNQNKNGMANTASTTGTKGSIAGIIQGQGVAVGPICIGGGGGGGGSGAGGRKSLENPHNDEKDFRDSSRSRDDYPRSGANDNYVDENYLLQGGGTSTRHNTKKVLSDDSDALSQPLIQRRGTERHHSAKITTNHSFSQSNSNDRSFSKSVKKIYSIFNVHESPDTARRLDFYFRYLYFLMFGLFNAIYWTHVKMAADSSREPLPKNFGPGPDDYEKEYGQ